MKKGLLAEFEKHQDKIIQEGVLKKTASGVYAIHPSWAVLDKLAQEIYGSPLRDLHDHPDFLIQRS